MIGGYAIKIPVLVYGWKNFLHGLIANYNEIQLSKWAVKSGNNEFCPVKWYIPGGWIVVMPRVKVMTDEEFKSFDYHGFVYQKDYVVPCENKSDSFGWLPNGKIVVIDYGN